MVPRPPHSILLGFVAALAFLSFSGCRQPEQASEAEAEYEGQVTDVALRICVVGQLEDSATITRRWLADSDQPIEIVAVEPAGLLAPDFACDVLVFPARFLGELVSSQKIMKLPSQVSDLASGLAEASETQTNNGLIHNELEKAQTTYDGAMYGLTLGISIPVVIGSAAVKLETEQADWETLLSQIESAPSATGISVSDPQAVVDRFLAIVATLTERNPNYGLLFEMQDMTPRFQQPEFLEACRVLQALAQQPEAETGIGGSHSEAWAWACKNQKPAVTIALPPRLSDSDAMPDGQVISVEGVSAVSGWNVGSGAVAAISANCRQSMQSVAFIHWLRESQNRDALADTIDGVTPTSPTASTPLSWMALKQAQGNPDEQIAPREPSLPATIDYRETLANELVAMLAAEKTAEEAMRAVTDAWQTLTDKMGPAQRTSYERSLGLSL